MEKVERNSEVEKGKKDSSSNLIVHCMTMRLHFSAFEMKLETKETLLKRPAVAP